MGIILLKYICLQTILIIVFRHSSITSSTNRNAYTRHNLDLITKYTSPQKLFRNKSFFNN